MSTAYFECFNGIAGDMVIGAMLHAGLPLEHLQDELSKLGLSGYKISVEEKWRTIHGADFKVHIEDKSYHKKYAEIIRIIEDSSLSGFVKGLSKKIFKRMGEAESAVHGYSVGDVHFHEVGDIDAIVDVVGACIGVEYFNFDLIAASPIPFGGGSVKCAHGVLPNPAPATLELLKGIPLETCAIKDEIVTPTGAAIITTIAQHFGESPLQKIEKIGYGFGDKDYGERVNALRLLIGDGFPVVVIEANIDDMNPQIFGYVMERLLERGAVDVLMQPMQMKKNRPGILLSCQSPWNKKDELIDIILKETTTFGVRYYPVERKVLKRELKTVIVENMNVRIKQGFDDDGNLIKEIPEYEDVKRLAREKNLSLQSVYKLVLEKV
ncbi:MAG: nickel pincer cofactor biosynthesis protein LarC [Pseudomonadota bacterium]